jgi:hypothetical protein
MFSACSNAPRVETLTTPVEVMRPETRPALPNPQAIHLTPFNWFVITPERLPNGDEWVYYGITPQQYEILARNMAEILRWVKEAQWRLDYYRGEDNVNGRRTSRDSGDGGSNR